MCDLELFSKIRSQLVMCDIQNKIMNIAILCDPLRENRAYVRKIHLFILLYVSPLLFKVLEIFKLHEIPYEKLHKWCNFY